MSPRETEPKSSAKPSAKFAPVSGAAGAAREFFTRFRGAGDGGRWSTATLRILHPNKGERLARALQGLRWTRASYAGTNSHASLTRDMRRGCKSLFRSCRPLSNRFTHQKEPAMNLAAKHNIEVSLRPTDTVVLTIVNIEERQVRNADGSTMNADVLIGPRKGATTAPATPSASTTSPPGSSCASSAPRPTTWPASACSPRPSPRATRATSPSPTPRPAASKGSTQTAMGGT